MNCRLSVDSFDSTQRDCGRRGMSTSLVDAAAVGITVDEAFVHVTLRDGRVLSAPLIWFPRLRDATDEQRAQWRIIGRGEGIRWDAVDEDVSVAALLRTA
jgi:hypothetical protein